MAWQAVRDIKLVLLGDTSVGKTSLVLRFCHGTFNNSTTPTIGASFLTKQMDIDNQKIKLQIWDTAGMERFRSLAPMYYRGAKGAVIVFDVQDISSFERAKDWISELKTNNPGAVIAIVANKVDLPDRKVGKELVSELATSIGAISVETSAKLNQGIDELFTKITSTIMASGNFKTVDDNTIYVTSNSPPTKSCC